LYLCLAYSSKPAAMDCAFVDSIHFRAQMMLCWCSLSNLHCWASSCPWTCYMRKWWELLGAHRVDLGGGEGSLLPLGRSKFESWGLWGQGYPGHSDGAQFPEASAFGLLPTPPNGIASGITALLSLTSWLHGKSRYGMIGDHKMPLLLFHSFTGSFPSTSFLCIPNPSPLATTTFPFLSFCHLKNGMFGFLSLAYLT
jgi:hypothetical protein